MIIYYRLSDGSYPKVRFQNATKYKCLRNFITSFMASFEDACAGVDDHLYLILDNVQDRTFITFNEIITSYRDQGLNVFTHRTYAGSSAGSFRDVFKLALMLADVQQVYFVEDDYAHLPGSRRVLLEGLERADYVTLYNHPDKYLPARLGGNPLVGEDGAEQSKVFVTDHAYWMLTNSTTMTFATTVGVLKEDQEVWKAFTEGTYPQDMRIFLELRKKGRTLIQPIPTFSTHCEPQWAAKLIGTGQKSWEDVLGDN